VQMKPIRKRLGELSTRAGAEVGIVCMYFREFGELLIREYHVARVEQLVCGVVQLDPRPPEGLDRRGLHKLADGFPQTQTRVPLGVPVSR